MVDSGTEQLSLDIPQGRNPVESRTYRLWWTSIDEELEREARLESAKRDANAQVMLAEASAESIRRVAAAVGTETAPMLFLLGEKYIASLERMGSTDNAKVVVLPADLQEAVRGLVGGALKR